MQEEVFYEIIVRKIIFIECFNVVLGILFNVFMQYNRVLIWVVKGIQVSFEVKWLSCQVFNLGMIIYVSVYIILCSIWLD